METRSKNFIKGIEQAIVVVDGGMRRKLMGFDGQLMLLEIAFTKGEIGYVHQHFHSQTSYVVSGVFEVTINGEAQVLKAGDGFYVEPNALHGAVCIESGVLIDSFSPARQDFL